VHQSARNMAFLCPVRIRRGKKKKSKCPLVGCGGQRGPAGPTGPKRASRIGAPVSCAALITLTAFFRSLVECVRCRGTLCGPRGPLRGASGRGPGCRALRGPRRAPTAAPTGFLGNGSENVKQNCPGGRFGGLLLWAAVWPMPVLAAGSRSIKIRPAYF